jgi:predicted PurR-regulated permease PerM
MNKAHTETIFFYTVFATIFVLTFFLFKPFLTTILLAATLAVVLNPIYLNVRKFVSKNSSFASIITIFLSIVFIITPIFMVGQRAFFEAKDLYFELSNNNVSEFDFILNTIEVPLRQFIPDFTLNINQYTGLLLSWLTEHFKDFIFGTISFAVDFVLMIIALFFFLKDGDRFISKLVAVSPFRDSYDREIVSRISTTISSVVKGSLLIGLIQGFLVGLGLFIFSVPNAFLWGIVASLAAFVPGLGTSLVVFPSVIYLFLTGNSPYAFGLALWGMILVGTIDNILAPTFYKKGTKVHSLIMLFSVLGGLSFFGPEGFIFGPVIVSVFIAFIDIYTKDQLNN